MSDIDLASVSESVKCNVMFTPYVEEEWWKKHVKYSTFNRQGIDIFTASFIHDAPKGNVIFVTGWRFKIS